MKIDIGQPGYYFSIVPMKPAGDFLLEFTGVIGSRRKNSWTAASSNVLGQIYSIAQYS
jgi:hypothetical protein